jgi:hypothetical protein
MNRGSLLGFGALLLLPYLVSLDGDSSDVPRTFVEYAISRGLYADVSRDCSGNVVSVDKHDFWDAGAKVVHKVSVLKLTAGAGAFTDMGNLQVVPYLSGTVGLNTKYFGLDGGGAFLFASEQNKIKAGWIPSLSLRLGREDLFYLSGGIAQNTALFGGNSLIDLGIGIGLQKPGSLLWLGIGGIPYEGSILSAKLDYPVSEKVTIQPRVGIGLARYGEYSVGFGARMAF